LDLIDELEQRAKLETSLFRAQMLREDIVRLRKLEDLVRSTPEPDACRRAARRLGWTALDARTHELAAPLDRLVDAVRLSQHDTGGRLHASEVRDAWLELTRLRIERMVGCLTTRLPEPSDQ
jgi:hypothetical protein